MRVEMVLPLPGVLEPPFTSLPGVGALPPPGPLVEPFALPSVEPALEQALTSTQRANVDRVIGMKARMSCSPEGRDARRINGRTPTF